MRPDDFVLLPDAPEGVLHVGRVEGDYRWNEAPTDGCRLPRRRAVIWVRDVPLADVPNAVVRALEGTETLTNLDGLRTRVLDLAAGRSAAMSAGMGEAALLERVVASIHAVGEDAFPGFLRGLFAALGYDAEVLPGRRDGWWEALGRVSASGLADVVLRVAASRVLGELDVDRVYAMRGSLATEEQGAVLTLGGFTAAARAEASARGKKPVRLVDGPTLAALAIEHWDDLPPATRKALGLQRVERATIEVRFEPASGT
jgi:hypothetical protein